jgi:hypothetical protein
MRIHLRFLVMSPFSTALQEAADGSGLPLGVSF